MVKRPEKEATLSGIRFKREWEPRLPCFEQNKGTFAEAGVKVARVGPRVGNFSRYDRRNLWELLSPGLCFLY